MCEARSRGRVAGEDAGMGVVLASRALAFVTGYFPTRGQDAEDVKPAGNVLSLSVAGKVPRPLKLDAEGFARLPRQKRRQGRRVRGRAAD